MTLLRQAIQDFAYVLIKSHVEHLVGLVKHSDRHLGKVDRAAVHVVKHSARRCNDDLRAAL